MISRTAVGFALLLCAPIARAQNVVKYHTTMDDVKYTYNSTSAAGRAAHARRYS